MLKKGAKFQVKIISISKDIAEERSVKMTIFN